MVIESTTRFLDTECMSATLTEVEITLLQLRQKYKWGCQREITACPTRFCSPFTWQT